jgi:hypothetical protein
MENITNLLGLVNKDGIEQYDPGNFESAFNYSLDAKAKDSEMRH